MTPQVGSYVFISYSKKQRDYARRLADSLLHGGFDVWIDDRIDYGENWWNEIVGAVQNCAALVVVMTPDSRQSRWVQREVQLAENAGKPIFPLLLEGDNWELFVLTQYLDVRNRQLPTRDFAERLAEVVPHVARRGRLTAPSKPARRPAPNGQAHHQPRSFLRGLFLLLLIGGVVAVVVWLASGGGFWGPTPQPLPGGDLLLLEVKSPPPANYELLPGIEIDPDAAHQMVRLVQWKVIQLRSGEIVFEAGLIVENLANRPIPLGFDARNFSLRDANGPGMGELVKQCCPIEVLPPGKHHEIQLVFTDAPGLVKSGSREVRLRVEGLYPVDHAVWILPLPPRAESYQTSGVR